MDTPHTAGEGVNSEIPLAGLPLNMTSALARGMAVLQELSEGITPDEAIRRRRDELRELIAPCDTVHLLGQLLMRETPLDPETYSESEHHGVAYVVEFVAAELAARSTRSGSAVHTPMMDATFLTKVHDLVQEVAILASLARARELGVHEDPEANARSRAAMQNLMVRGPGWPWQEHETLRGLFGPPHLAARLQDIAGFTVEDAIACAEAATGLIPEHLNTHIAETRTDLASADKTHPAISWAASELGGWSDIPSEYQADVALGAWALVHMGEAFVLTPGELAGRAGVGVAAARSFLSTLATSLSSPAEDWFSAAESVRRHPYLEIEDGAYMPTVPGNDLWALRAVFESALKGDKGYLRHRARWLEQQAVTRLADAVQADERHCGLTYECVDDSGTPLQGEIDGLVRVGDVALIVEAKSATLRPGARRGGAAFLSHLRENLTKAAEQGARTASALRVDATLRQGRSEIKLGAEIREVHLIAVTLDDLSPVAPIIWQLQGTRVLPAGTMAPWLVTLHELDLICQTVEWPAQVVHFLRRRARLNLHGGIDASDELDLWMHYLGFGLYFDPAAEERIRLASFTDPLDAWVLYERGERKAPAPKPRMTLDDEAREFLDLLCEERPPPAWVAAAGILLDMSGAARAEFWTALEELRRRAVARNRTQRCTLGFTEDDPMIVCAAVVPDAHESRLPEVLRGLVAERLDEHGVQRVLAVGRTVSGTRPYDALVVVDRTWREPTDAIGGWAKSRTSD